MNGLHPCVESFPGWRKTLTIHDYILFQGKIGLFPTKEKLESLIVADQSLDTEAQTPGKEKLLQSSAELPCVKRRKHGLEAMIQKYIQGI